METMQHALTIVCNITWTQINVQIESCFRITGEKERKMLITRSKGHTRIAKQSSRKNPKRLFTQLTFLPNDDLIKALLIHLCPLFVTSTFVSFHRDLYIILKPI